MGRIASVCAFSGSNSVLNALDSLTFGRKVARTEIKNPPIFVLGHWRSGTTLLHNLFSLDPQFAYCNLYEVLFPRHFLLSEKWIKPLTKWVVPSKRPMDNMPNGWDLAQEDETAILLMSLLSPYLLLAFPDDTSVFSDYFTFEGASESDRQRWKDTLLEFAKRLTYQYGRQLVFKSPAHSMRIPLIREIFPDARFVFIHRNPFDVYTSAVHLRRVMFRDNFLGRSNLDSLEEDILNLFADLNRVYQRDRTTVPQGHLSEVSYAELVSDPTATMGRIYGELNLDGFGQLEQEIGNRMNTHRNYRTNSYKLDDEARARVVERWKQVFLDFGYPIDDEGDESAAVQSRRAG